MRIQTVLGSLAALALVAAPALAGEYGKKKDGAYKAKQDIVAIAAADPQFSTLVSLVGEAGLVATLQGEGPFTVFAPTNDAFAKLDPETVAAVRADKDLLTGVLTYHVLSGKVKSKAIVGNTLSVATVNGAEVTANGTGEGVTINDANVIKADIYASNGVIHVIDTVLIPPAAE
jgi:uncharacterized surface protein with fasciclin (FAS1) repeats